MALRIFHYQLAHNDVYRQFVEGLGRPIPKEWEEIPCLPISLFKSHKVQTGTTEPEMVFSSSGTTGQQSSRHLVMDMAWYKRSFLQHFEAQYGAVDSYCVLGLLPAYMERQGSSLVYMVNQLIANSGHPLSGTYLYEHDELRAVLTRLKAAGQKTILFGVTFGLLDFVEAETFTFPELIVMETGGMKGRRKEMIREELHQVLKQGFEVSQIHSEYGMTELLSQAYAPKDGRYYCPPWMKVRAREVADPLNALSPGRSGGLDVFDLANVHSCAFIATEDLVRTAADGSFEVLGRFDHSEIRGCSLMV